MNLTTLFDHEAKNGQALRKIYHSEPIRFNQRSGCLEIWDAQEVGCVTVYASGINGEIVINDAYHVTVYYVILNAMIVVQLEHFDRTDENADRDYDRHNRTEDEARKMATKIMAAYKQAERDLEVMDEETQKRERATANDAKRTNYP